MQLIEIKSIKQLNFALKHTFPLVAHDDRRVLDVGNIGNTGMPSAASCTQFSDHDVVLVATTFGFLSMSWLAFRVR
jgi:hypothetical protein